MQRQVFSGTDERFELKLASGSLEMQLDVWIDRRKGMPDFRASAVFLRDGQKVDVRSLVGDNDFEAIVLEYERRAKSFTFEEFESSIDESVQEKGFAKARRYIRNLYLDIEVATKGLNVFAMDSDNRSLARTVIEPDADILTVTRSDLDDKARKLTLLLHTINVTLINRFLRFRFTRFLNDIGRSVALVKRMIGFVGISSTATYYFGVVNSQLDDIWMNLSSGTPEWHLFGQFAIPIATILLRRYWGRLLFYAVKLSMKPAMK